VNLCVGIGTDLCSVMTSEKVGAVKETQKEASNAFRRPCFNHALNLPISASSSVVSIRNSNGVIKETIAFLTSSAKRRVVVDSICVQKIKQTLRKSGLKLLQTFLAALKPLSMFLMKFQNGRIQMLRAKQKH
jgi:hypothetical protein